MGMTGVARLSANVYINIKIYDYFMGIFMDLLNEFGTYGPIILIFLSLYLLWNNHNLFFYYIVGLFLNTIFNLVLKGIFQQPRPSEDIKMFHLALRNGKDMLFKNGIPNDIFGMPSGHCQSAMFSTIFVYLSLRKKNILYTYLLISFIIMMQRILYNYHTVAQVIVGDITGALVGLFFYYLATEKLKGHIREKKDDFGPI